MIDLLELEDNEFKPTATKNKRKQKIDDDYQLFQNHNIKREHKQLKKISSPQLHRAAHSLADKGR